MKRFEFVEIIAAAELLGTSFGEWLLQRFGGKLSVGIAPGTMGATVEQGVAGGLAELAGRTVGTLPLLHGEIQQITSRLPEVARIDVDAAWYGKVVPTPSDFATRFILLLVSALGKELRRKTTPQPCPPCHADPVVEANRELLRERSAAGIEKYRTTLAASGLSREQLLQHLLEELLDAANYTQAVLQTPAPARRVVAWRFLRDDGHAYAWNSGECPHELQPTDPAWRIERAYSE